jgi:hypothetical protein
MNSWCFSMINFEVCKFGALAASRVAWCHSTTAKVPNRVAEENACCAFPRENTCVIVSEINCEVRCNRIPRNCLIIRFVVLLPVEKRYLHSFHCYISSKAMRYPIGELDLVGHCTKGQPRNRSRGSNVSARRPSLQGVEQKETKFSVKWPTNNGCSHGKHRFSSRMGGSHELWEFINETKPRAARVHEEDFIDLRF